MLAEHPKSISKRADFRKYHLLQPSMIVCWIADRIFIGNNFVLSKTCQLP